MNIEDAKIISAYNAADGNGRKLLKSLFPDMKFDANETLGKLPITERIKTFEDAYRELGSEHPFCKIWDLFIQTSVNDDMSNIADVLSYFKLRIICAALNEGWEPKFTEGEYRYYPWFHIYSEREVVIMNEDEKKELNLVSAGSLLGSYANDGAYDGFGWVDSSGIPSVPRMIFGSRLCLKSKKLATYCGKQFTNIWVDLNLIINK